MRDRHQDTYIVLHGVLYYRSAGTHRVYVPVSLRKKLLYEFHDIEIAGHFGWRKTLYALQHHYFWPQMSESQCPTRQRTKPTKVQPPCIKALGFPCSSFPRSYT
jgi:Integrase zinc binding domain